MEAPSNSFSRGTALGLTILSTREGARSQDPRKYQKDAAILETALGSEQDPFLRSRYAFYLARSYRDCGENERALPYFLMRAELGYWTEEIFMSLYGAGQVQEQLEHPVDEVIGTYLRASETSPTRAEALHAASRLCRVKGRFHEAYRYARQGLAIPQPEGGLFVESWIYDYGLLDEFAVSAYWVGAFRDSFDASLKLLGGGKLPPSMVQRVATNAQFAADRILSPSSPIVNHERPVRHARDYADIMDHLGAKCSPAFSVQVNEASRLLS
jgi:tetratricopeptide (TPR) repeat protein